MKKTILLAALLVAMTAFAYAETTIPSAGTTINAITYMPSNNVTVIAEANDANYTVAAGHLNGDKVFQATSENPEIKSDVTKAKGSIAEIVILTLPGG